MRQSTSKRWCFVPGCTNTNLKTPNKLFICVPKGTERKKWMKIVRRHPDECSLTSVMFCCEDHFTLQDDLENYMRVKLDPTSKILLKKGIVPHIFDCQTDRQRAFSKPDRQAVSKLNNVRILKEIEQEKAKDNELSCKIQEKFEVESVVKEKNIVAFENVETEQQNVLNEKNKFLATFEVNYFIEKKDCGVQTLQLQKPHYRSKSTSCCPKTKNVSCSPIKQLSKENVNNNTRSLDSQNSNQTSKSDLKINSTMSSTSSILCSSCDSSKNSDITYIPDNDEVNSEESACLDCEKKHLYQKVKMMQIMDHPKLFTCIPAEAIYLLKLLSEDTKISITNICIVLTKMKTNDSFERIGIEFGLSTSEANRIFRKSVPLLAHCCKKLIIWPNKERIKALLPIAFRSKYSNVQSLLDCFEISTQKPSNPIHQALTYSEYKKGNTAKYLISSTPDGLINFISEGFGGRTSDVLIVEKSDFINVLPQNSAVMADRGFKFIDKLLQTKNCTLIRPPSVSANKKSSKEQVIETRRIASLRIHIERVICRIRYFEILKPHASIPIETLDIIDQILVIAVSIINFHGVIIRQ